MSEYQSSQVELRCAKNQQISDSACFATPIDDVLSFQGAPAHSRSPTLRYQVYVVALNCYVIRSGGMLRDGRFLNYDLILIFFVKLRTN